MAILHQARLSPTKLEAIGGWLARQPWYEPTPGELERVGAFRFDDPEGEVGIETVLVRAGNGPVVQVPITYRGAPLAGAEDALMTTMEHSVLGRRWAYDGCADPAYAETLATTILTGGHEAPLMVEVDGVVGPAPAQGEARGSGRPGAPVPGRPSTVRTSTRDGVTTIETGELTLRVRRILDATVSLGEGETLTARGSGSDQAWVVVASVDRG